MDLSKVTDKPLSHNVVLSMPRLRGIRTLVVIVNDPTTIRSRWQPFFLTFSVIFPTIKTDLQCQEMNTWIWWFIGKTMSYLNYLYVFTSWFDIFSKIKVSKFCSKCSLAVFFKLLTLFLCFLYLSISDCLWFIGKTMSYVNYLYVFTSYTDLWNLTLHIVLSDYSCLRTHWDTCNSFLRVARESPWKRVLVFLLIFLKKSVCR
jgi:hypothetical protein